MSKAECIYEWFQDHFDTFGCYPMDWIDYADTDFTHTDSPDLTDEKGRLYGWDECWAILNKNYPNIKWREVE